MIEERDPKPAEASTTATATTTTTTTVERKRKKRKWDQPAQSLISAGLAVTGSLPLASGGIVGIPLPGTFPLPSSVVTHTVSASSATTSLLLHSSSLSLNPAAIVQKLTQPKIQDESIAREIIINDAEPTIRYKLTKRQTQDEIQRSTGAIVITRGKYRPPNALPDNEKPLYLHISAGAHLEDTAERIKAVDRAASMVEDILKQGQNFLPVTTPFNSTANNGQTTQLMNASLPLGFETDPSLNIAARIRGPNDQYINHIMNETGATVVLRGRGSGNLDNFSSDDEQQPLHLYISSSNSKSLEAARSLAENLLDTIAAECGASRVSSSKVYSAVPPPQQLLPAVQSSGEMIGMKTNPVASLPYTAGGPTSLTQSLGPNGAICMNAYPPGSASQLGGVASYGIQQPQTVSYSYPTVTGGTCYNGYGGIYPQATPLQQVALALRKVPAPATSSLPSTICVTTSCASTASSVSMASNTPSGLFIEPVKRAPQKRKFQELPVPSKESAHNQNSLQGSESKASYIRNASTMPPPKKMIHAELDGMPPPPPPRTMPPPPPPPKFPAPASPPPPPKFSSLGPACQIGKRLEPVIEKSNDKPVSDTLLKLVEYGEEEDDDIDASAEENDTSYLARHPSSKPFWAV